MRLTRPEDVKEAFTYVKPDTEAQQKHELIQQAAVDFGIDILNHVPNCYARDIAMQKIEEAKMWANAAIAHKGKF